jgi:GNAT superfamily N-acetyltransferase
MRDPATNDMKNEVLRRLSAEDADRILDLNNEHAVETSLLDLFAAERLLAMCFYAKCAGAGERGFLLALDQGAAYDNQNFRWFFDCFERFVYIDRIIIEKDARGQGFARFMYEDLFAEAKAVEDGPPPPGRVVSWHHNLSKNLSCFRARRCERLLTSKSGQRCPRDIEDI